MWLAAGTLGISLRGLLKDLLSGEPDWKSRGHWIDRLCHRAVSLESPTRCIVSGPMIWGLSEDVGGPQYAWPFEAELTLAVGYSELVGYMVRFGDLRPIPDEPLPDCCRRITLDIERGSIEWAYVIRSTAAETA